MKIDPGNVIRIALRSGSGGFSGKIDVGAEVPVRVIERQGRTSALLDMGGRHVRAEFTGGVPVNNSLVLRLARVLNDLFIFSIARAASRRGFFDGLLEYSLLKHHEAAMVSPAEIGRIMGSRREALFTLQAMLMNAAEGHSRAEKARLLARIFSFDLSVSVRSELAWMMAVKGLGGVLAYFLSGLLTGDRQRRWGKDAPAIAGDIALELDAALEAEEPSSREETLRFLVAFLSGGADDSGQGVVPLWGDEGYLPVQYISRGDVVVLSVELSAAGTVDIMARREKGGLTARVFCASEEFLSEMRMSLAELLETLKKSGIEASIALYNRNFVIDKIIELSTYYSTQSAFDARA